MVMETMKRKHKMKNSESKNSECPVCSSGFMEDLSRDCNHICQSCEIILLQCPVCVEIIQLERGKKESIMVEEGGNGNIKSERLDQVIGEILADQKKSAVGEGTLLQAKAAPAPIHSQILKHCFIGVWDGAINCVAAAMGLKSTKANIIARNINNIILRIGRQTGRSVQPSVCNKLSKPTAVKAIGGLAAVLLIIQIILRRYK